MLNAELFRTRLRHPQKHCWPSRLAIDPQAAAKHQNGAKTTFMTENCVGHSLWPLNCLHKKPIKNDDE